jgi:uroporphyrinogen-III synthase
VSASSHSLHGLRVLVTRPAAQAASLCQRINAAGGLVLPFPVLEIQALTPPPVHLASVYALVFVSVNAVVHGLPLLRPYLTPQHKIIAVGEKTAHALADYPQVLTPPTQFDSDGMLALPALQDVAGKHILIVRGEGGREVLSAGLRARGAMVDYLHVYRRVCPPFTPAPWQEQGAVDVIIASSGTGLENIFTLLGSYPWLTEKIFVVISARLAEAATARGIKQVHTAARADDDGLFDALFAVRIP